MCRLEPPALLSFVQRRLSSTNPHLKRSHSLHKMNKPHIKCISIHTRKGSSTYDSIFVVAGLTRGNAVPLPFPNVPCRRPLSQLEFVVMVELVVVEGKSKTRIARRLRGSGRTPCGRRRRLPAMAPSTGHRLSWVIRTSL